MSWEAIIDQMKEWVLAQSFLTTGYVDRGDPIFPDFTIVDFVIDGFFHPKDLSAIVPAGAKAVLLGLVAVCPQDGFHTYFRKFGNVNQMNMSRAIIDNWHVPIYQDMIVAVDENRIIDVQIDNVIWIIYELTVRGWWL